MSVSFVAMAETFAEPPAIRWRAVQITGEVPGGQLPRILRELADWYERELPQHQPAS